MACGAVITAVGGPCKGVIGYVPVPREWPEQQVRIAEEDISPEVTVSYETVEGGAKIMPIKIPNLEAGKEAKAVVTLRDSPQPVVGPGEDRRL